MASEHIPNVLNLWSVEVAKRMFQVEGMEEKQLKKKKIVQANKGVFTAE